MIDKIRSYFRSKDLKFLDEVHGALYSENLLKCGDDGYIMEYNYHELGYRVEVRGNRYDKSGVYERVKVTLSNGEVFYELTTRNGKFHPLVKLSDSALIHIYFSNKLKNYFNGV